MLWAATTSSEKLTIAAAQIRARLEWLTAFAGVGFAPMERRCRKHPPFWTVIAFDGSVYGGSATLQIGVSDLAKAQEAPIVAYLSEQWKLATFAS